MENDGDSDAREQPYKDKDDCLMRLPEEILHRIGSLHLPSPKDGIRFSAACKLSRSLAPRIRSPRSPWLLFRHKNDGSCKFFDPLTKSTYTTVITDLSGATFHHSKYGWVIASQNQSSWFFYNPFTNQRIALPNLRTAVQGVSFSAPPTSSECVVFAIKSLSGSDVDIYTCHPGDEGWVTLEDTPNNCSRAFRLVQNNPVFYRGDFYSMGLDGNVGVFNPSTSTWKVLEKPTNSFKHRRLNCYLVESGGELFSFTTGFIVNPSAVVNPVHVFRLDHPKMTWMRAESLGDRAAFLSQETSICDSMGIKEMENKIYFPSFRQDNPDDMVVYSPGANHSHFRTKTYANRTWIDPRGYVFEFCYGHPIPQLKFICTIEENSPKEHAVF